MIVRITQTLVEQTAAPKNRIIVGYEYRNGIAERTAAWFVPFHQNTADCIPEEWQPSIRLPMIEAGPNSWAASLKLVEATKEQA